MKVRIGMFFGAALLAGNMAWAQNPPENQLREGPCRADAERLCKGVEQGKGRLLGCLRGKEDLISAECKAKVSDRRAKAKGKFESFVNSCQDDLNKFCADIQIGEARKLKCLQAHAPSLTAECKGALPKRFQR